MIGIVSHDQDLHAAEVRRHLASMGASVALFDTAKVPVGVPLTTRQDPVAGWSGAWGRDGPDLREVRVMWWRRPQPFVLSDDLAARDDRVFAVGECQAAVSGLWACLDATWVNDPDRDTAASRKMWQLKLAQELGLRVPRTCITSDPDVARAFIASEPGRVIFKPFGGTPETWRETRPIRPVDLPLLDHVRFAPVIFQQAIEGGCDIRVTIAGDTLFAAAIQARSEDTAFDFRIDPQAPMQPHDLPAPVRTRLLALMARLGLRYGAVDLRLDPDGEHVFLEINPAGQWLFVEYGTGQPISAAVAALLAGLDRPATREAR